MTGMKRACGVDSRAVGVLASEEGGTCRAAQRGGRHKARDPNPLPP